MKTILIVGGTGAQGSAVVRALVATGEYHILLFTRDITSRYSRALIAHGSVEGVPSNAEYSYDISAFEEAARRADGVFNNTDGFALGEQGETYLGIRLFETAVASHVKHIVYSGLDNSWRESGYDPSLYVGHYQGKARVQGPYIEMLSESLLPVPSPSTNTYAFALPLSTGAIPFIHLADLGRYVTYIFTHPTTTSSLDLGIATAHVTGPELATVFTAVTGKPATYTSISPEAWTAKAFENLPRATTRRNWWLLYQRSAGNQGLIRRDYELLDRILPGRVRSMREWMERVGYDGSKVDVLKGYVKGED